jgi:hypothetical protein
VGGHRLRHTTGWRHTHTYNQSMFLCRLVGRRQVCVACGHTTPIHGWTPESRRRALANSLRNLMSDSIDLDIQVCVPCDLPARVCACPPHFQVGGHRLRPRKKSKFTYGK